MNNMYICNANKSPPDARDWTIKNDVDFKETLDLRNDLQPVRDQGNQGTCYAQSAACAKEWQEKKDYNLDEYLSPQFFYNNRFNKYDSDTTNDEGMYGRNVMKLLCNIGICTENEYKYGRIEDITEIPDDIFSSAKKHCIKNYAKVATLNQLKIALNKYGPCLIAFPVYNYSDQMWIKTDNDTFKGGHAMTVVGYTENRIIIRNSWGKLWGDDGYCYYNFSDWGAHWELWSVVDDKTFVTPPEPEPEPVPIPTPTPVPIPLP
jgi:C1A family cysteine protease